MAIGMVVTDDKPLSFIAQFQYMLFHWRIRYCFDSPFFESTQAPGKTGFGFCLAGIPYLFPGLREDVLHGFCRSITDFYETMEKAQNHGN